MKPIHKVQILNKFVREHRRGDIRDDGMVFESYRYIGDKVYERWATPQQLIERKLSSNKASSAWAKRPENRMRQSRAVAASNRRLRKITPARFILSAAKARAKKNGLPFDITLDDISVPPICPVLGIPLIVGDKIQSDNSPSIDRIVPELGYVRGNVLVISRRANRIKNDATADELHKVFNYVFNHVLPI